jgi:hypothetical protein
MAALTVHAVVTRAQAKTGMQDGFGGWGLGEVLMNNRGCN